MRSRLYLHLNPDREQADGARLLIDYSSVELAKKVVEKIADDPSATVDNDFGTILPGDRFVARCRSERDWDWRQRPE